MEKNIDKAFSEVLDMLNYIEPQYKVKIPSDMMNMFKEECDKTYLKQLLNDKTEIKEKKYSEEALSIIAYLNLKYWCESVEEKNIYRNLYLKNNIK